MIHTLSGDNMQNIWAASIRLSTRQFDYSRQNRTFYVEASALRWKPGMVPTILALKSHTTGNVERFTLDFIDEAGGLRYVAQDRDLFRKGVEVFVFND